VRTTAYINSTEIGQTSQSYESPPMATSFRSSSFSFREKNGLKD